MQLVGYSATLINPVNMIVTDYAPSTDSFPNPERGFFSPFEPSTTPFTVTQLKEIRTRNITLARRIYNIGAYRNSTIPQSYLDTVKGDLDAARTAGVKLIPRFTYNWVGGGDDAPLARTLGHLDQLKPVLAGGADVIAFMEAGMVGYWGQWNRSSNGHVQENLDMTDSGRQIYDRMLTTYPRLRQILLPYPRQKYSYLALKGIANPRSPMPVSEAHTGTARSRTGSHNDGFLHDSTDFGYYTWDYVEGDKTNLNAEGLYIFHGGETASGSTSYSGCTNAKKELTRMRWTYINSFDKGWGDGLGILNQWRNEGCFPEIERNLGYRLRLVSSSIQDRVKPGGRFQMSFTVTNDGYSSLINPRHAYILLINRATGQQRHLSLSSENIRAWHPGVNRTVSIDVGIPTNMALGEYDVRLLLPDINSALHSRPEYAVRLANQNTWLPANGHNSMLRTLIVDSTSGETYSGTVYFQ
jgi:hypothetical protein